MDAGGGNLPVGVVFPWSLSAPKCGFIKGNEKIVKLLDRVKPEILALRETIITVRTIEILPLRETITVRIIQRS